MNTGNIVLLPLLSMFMVIPICVIAGLKYRARLQQERAEHDQKRFLRMGYLRKRAREDEQRSFFVNFLRRRAR